MPLSAMLIPAALADRINADIFLLSLVCLLAYCGASIQNSIKDKDYLLPSYAHYMVYILPILAFVFACTNIIILLTLISWILLGVIYNTIARRLIFGDIAVLSLTHLAIPMVSSSLLIGFPLKESMIAAAYICLLFILMGNMKNIKDAKSDKKRGYKTINTITKKGEQITICLAGISWVMMFFALFIFDLSYRFFIPFAAITALAIYSFSLTDKAKGFHLFKMAFILFLFSIIVAKTSNITIIITGAVYCAIYFIPMIVKKMPKIRIKKEVNIHGYRQ